MSYTIPRNPGKESDNAKESFQNAVCERRDKFFDDIFQCIAKESRKAYGRRCVVEILPDELLVQFTRKVQKYGMFGVRKYTVKEASEKVYGDNVEPLSEESAISFTFDKIVGGIFSNTKYTYTVMTYDPYYRKLIADAKKENIKISLGLEKVTASATGDSWYELAVYARW